jgi:hypothetical protein
MDRGKNVTNLHASLDQKQGIAQRRYECRLEKISLYFNHTSNYPTRRARDDRGKKNFFANRTPNEFIQIPPKRFIETCRAGYDVSFAIMKTLT